MLVDFGDDPVDDGADFDGVLVDVEDPLDSEVVDAVPLDESEESEPEEPASVDTPLGESELEPGGVVALESRLSVLKKPEALNVTPTGWNIFLIGRMTPDSG